MHHSDFVYLIIDRMALIYRCMIRKYRSKMLRGMGTIIVSFFSIFTSLPLLHSRLPLIIFSYFLVNAMNANEAGADQRIIRLYYKYIEYI